MPTPRAYQVHYLAPDAIVTACGLSVMGGTRVTDEASCISCPDCESAMFFAKHGGPVIRTETLSC